MGTTSPCPAAPTAAGGRENEKRRRPERAPPHYHRCGDLTKYRLTSKPMPHPVHGANRRRTKQQQRSRFRNVGAAAAGAAAAGAAAAGAAATAAATTERP